MSSLALTPYYSDDKQRITKGKGIANPGWRKDNRWNPDNVKFKPFTKSVPATAWYLDLKQLGMYVIDIDVKGNNTGKDILKPEIYQHLFDNSQYVIQTGSGGLHFYYSKEPNIPVTKATKLDELTEQFLTDDAYANKLGDIDIITDFIISEYSTYTYEDKTYTYKSIKGSIEDNTEIQLHMWNAIKKYISKDQKKVNDDYDDEKEPSNSSSVDKSLLQKLVMGLNPKRADNYSDWIKIGFILKNENADIDIWIEFSKQSYKYKFGECEKVWRSFKNDGALTQRSLWRMLKEDNPILFQTLSTKRTDLENAFGGRPLHLPYAKHFVNCIPNDYLYCHSTGWWAIQTNNTWKNFKNIPPTLPIIIAEILTNELELYKKEVRNSLKTEPDSLQIKMKMNQIYDGMSSLCQIKFVTSIIDFCKSFYAQLTLDTLEQFNKKNVVELMNSNTNIWCFTDYIYDFTMINGKPIGKRNILPTDYVTITCNYKFPDRNVNVRKEILETLETIWSKQGEYGDNGETLNYVLTILSTTLLGSRTFEAFAILTGSGRNGKGLLDTLLQRVFGDYYYFLPVQVLTTKIKDQQSANPLLANLCGKRLVMSSEPEANNKLQEAIIKGITGGDPITARALYQDPITFKPQFGLFLQCNFVPLLNAVSRGSLLRNIIIPFPFEFCSDPISDKQKKSNPMIKDVLCKSEEWRNEFFWILADLLPSTYLKGADDIPRPTLVTERTEEYADENNAVGIWWKNNYQEAKGEYVLSKDAFTKFKIDTDSDISDKTFKQCLEFNLIQIKKITGGKMKDKMGIKGWELKPEK
jgi:P4 family phage/plasmid primase-like protien